MQNQQKSHNKKAVEVSTAVIRYHNKYLLGYRHKEQHQGDRYEFIGGKKENNESDLQALIREISEEIAVDITADQCQEMGVIEHDYSEIHVKLTVFAVQFNDQQFEQIETQSLGSLDQPLLWVEKSDLLARKYPLPDANDEILEWIRHD